MSDIPPIAHPEWLLPLAVVAGGCALALGWAFLRGERALLQLIGVAPGRNDRILRDVFLLTALLAMAFALAGPRFGTRELHVPATGLDLVMLMDVSRSMNAADIPPSRMARARRVAAGVLQRLGEGDRAALAIFAGQGALITPFTSDKGALAEMLPAVDPTLFSDASSDGAAGLRAALPAFAASGPRPRLLLVLSDGEIGRLPKGLAAELAQAEARVLAVLLGTEAGAPIPDRGRPLRGPGGKPVHTQRVLADLGPLVETSDGRLFLADGWGEVDLPALVAEIRRDAIPTAEGTLVQRVPISWVGPPALLVWLLLLLEAWPGEFRTKWRVAAEATPELPGRRVSSLAHALPWLVLGTLLPQAAEPGVAEPGGGVPKVAEHQTVEGQPDSRLSLEARLRAEGPSSAVLVALGIARARSGDTSNAGHAFRAAALLGGDPRTAALAWYDLGVLALESGRLEDARQAFFESLALDSRNRKTKFNLELTLAALQRNELAPPPNDAPNPDPADRQETDDSRADDTDAPNPDETSDEEAAADPTDNRTQQTRPEPQQGTPPEEPAHLQGHTEPPPPSMDQAEAEHWLDAQSDDVRAALEAQLGPLSGPWVGGSRW
ncbi:MAG: VWA domain-containing protein [bacterium]|nr:VWA domain-containing protein [bacterium]